MGKCSEITERALLPSPLRDEDDVPQTFATEVCEVRSSLRVCLNKTAFSEGNGWYVEESQGNKRFQLLTSTFPCYRYKAGCYITFPHVSFYTVEHRKHFDIESMMMMMKVFRQHWKSAWTFHQKSNNCYLQDCMKILHTPSVQYII